MSDYTYYEVHSNINDDEKAFPLTGYSPYKQRGMTLRDWFAGQALAGIVTRDEIRLSAYRPEEVHKIITQYAYGIADAMLEARKESK